MEFPKNYLEHLDSLLQCYPTYSNIVTNDTVYQGHKKRSCELRSGPVIGRYFFPHETRRILSKFTRTSMALLIKYLIMNNSDENYHFLVQDQSQPLTRSTYDMLSDAMFYFRCHPKMSELLDYYIILRGYAMTPQARERLRRTSGIHADAMRPMETLDNLLRHGQFYDQNTLSMASYSLLTHAIKADFSLSKVINGEAPPEISEYFEREDDEGARLFVLWSNMFEIAGMAGHIHCSGSRILSEQLANDFLLLRTFLLANNPIDRFIMATAEPIMRTSKCTIEEAVAALRLSRMMGAPSEANAIADLLIEKFPSYAKLVAELNHGFSWSHLAERPIVFEYGRNYLSSRYREKVETGIWFPAEECLQEVAPYLLMRIKALRKAAMRDRPLEHLLYLDLGADALRAGSEYNRARYRNQ